MVSLYDQLISEISSSNPRLSPEEVSDQIKILIENEILPAALTRMRLPGLPAPISVKREELRGVRYGMRARSRPLQNNVTFIQDLEKLRFKFDGLDSTNEDFFSGLTNDTQIPFGQKVRYIVEPNGKTLPDKPSSMQERLKVSSYLEKSEGITKKPPRLITFDLSITEKIVNEPLFEKVVGEVESKIRRNYDHETLKIYFNFSIRTDMDDPDREKTIIYVSLPTHSFDEKMELWDKIETDIRDVIKKLNVTEPERKAINRNLFTHIEPT